MYHNGQGACQQLATLRWRATSGDDAPLQAADIVLFQGEPLTRIVHADLEVAQEIYAKK